MQQSGAAAVHILIENFYKFKLVGGKKLIREFSDKGWHVKAFNNDKTNGKRPTSQCAF